MAFVKCNTQKTIERCRSKMTWTKIFKKIDRRINQVLTEAIEECR